MKAGATRGLDGKGVLYVFAAGNGHEIGQHPNLTGTRNSYLQTLACAVDSDGIREYYSEIDYVLWVCAPSANITTDNLNRYRQDFGGTSAAAPIVSGVAALVRSANPSLTWRDVKLILAGSARKTDPDNAGWEEGALKYGSDTERYSYNPEYGFGVVDATAAVELAQDWTTLPPFLNSSAETARTTLSIPETENGSDPTPLASKLSVISHVNFIEFVEVHVQRRPPRLPGAENHAGVAIGNDIGANARRRHFRRRGWMVDTHGRPLPHGLRPTPWRRPQRNLDIKGQRPLGRHRGHSEGMEHQVLRSR